MILRRYITREIYFSLLGIVGTLMLIIFINQVTQLLKEAALGNMTIRTVWQVAFLELFPIITYVLPLGFFLSILIVIGRLYRDSELVVMTACGLSLWKQFSIVGGIAIIVSIFSGFLSLYLNPMTVTAFKTLKDQSGAQFQISTLSPHRIKPLGDGSAVYVTDANHRDNTVKNVFLVQKKKHEHRVEWDITNAERGGQQTIYKNMSPYIILQNGNRYLLNSQTRALTHDQFTQFGFNIQSLTANQDKHEKKIHIDGVSTIKLMHMHGDLDAIAELQLRFSVPLAVLISSLLAVTFSEVNPRRASSLYIIPAIATFAVYMILIYLCKGWVSDGKIVPWIGSWWVHILMIFFTLILISVRTQWLKRWLYARRQHANP